MKTLPLALLLCCCMSSTVDAPLCQLEESAEGQICYLRCSGNQHVLGSFSADAGYFDTLNVRLFDAGSGQVNGAMQVLGTLTPAAGINMGGSYQQRVTSSSWQLGSAGTQQIVWQDGVSGNRLRLGFSGLEMVSNADIFLDSLTGIRGPGGNLFYVGTAPTISSGFGTSPSIVASNVTAAFEVNVGTGGVATSGVIGLSTAATKWNCVCVDVTTRSTTVMQTLMTSSTTTSCTIGAFSNTMTAAAWVASDHLQCIAFAY